MHGVVVGGTCEYTEGGGAYADVYDVRRHDGSVFRARSLELVKTNPKFSELVDLILVRLYDLERNARPGGLFDVNAIVRTLKDKFPEQWVFDAGKVLESRGWGQVLFTFGGGFHARLTGEGRLYVEEERGTGIIKQYRMHPEYFVIETPETNKAAAAGTTGATAIEQERAPALQIVAQLREMLRVESTLSAAERDDLLSDVEMVEQQLKKREPNRAALAALLEPLARVTSIAGLVSELVRLLNP